MIEAIKDNWWAEKPKPIPVKRLGWRPIDPYCVQDIPYYDLTRHYGGQTGKDANKYTVNPIWGYTPPEGVMLQRRKEDDTIRESEIPNSTYLRPSFINNDVVASTLPLNKIRTFKARFHMIKEILFVPSLHTPDITEFDIRGNWTELRHLDMTNCKHLEFLVTSMCYIDSIALPPTGPNDTNNKFSWGYLGHYDVSDRRGMPPIQVVDAVTKRAYYSKLADSTPSSTTVKSLADDTGNGHLLIDGINMHEQLVNNKNWTVRHLSLETFNKSFNSSAAGTLTLDFLTSHHNYNVRIENADWLTCSNPTGSYSLRPQTLYFQATANTTGAPRSTVVKIRKIKEYPRTVSRAEDHNDEFHHAAHITITQPG